MRRPPALQRQTLGLTNLGILAQGSWARKIWSPMVLNGAHEAMGVFPCPSPGHAHLVCKTPPAPPSSHRSSSSFLGQRPGLCERWESTQNLPFWNLPLAPKLRTYNNYNLYWVGLRFFGFSRTHFSTIWFVQIIRFFPIIINFKPIGYPPPPAVMRREQAALSHERPTRPGR